MTTSEYLQILLLQSDTGITLNEFDLGDVFNLKPDDFKTIEDYTAEVIKRQELNTITLTGGTFKFNKKTWIYDEDYTKWRVIQWAKMGEILAQMKGQASAELVALFIRPQGTEFNINDLQDLTNEVYKMPAELYIALNNFFFQVATELLNYMSIHYLNQANKIKETSPVKKLKMKLYGMLIVSLSWLKGFPMMILFNLKRFFKWK